MTQPINDRLASILLAALLFVIASTVFDYILRKFQVYQSWPQIFLLTMPMLPLIGPTLLAYTNRAILGINPFAQPGWWRHLIPSLLFFGILSPHALFPEQTQVDMDSGGLASPWLTTVLLIIYAQIFVYVFLSVKSIFLYRRQINEIFSNTERLDLDWLVRLALSLSFALIAIPFGHIVIAIWWDSVPIIANLFIGLMGIFHFVIVFTGFAGLKQTYITPLIQAEEAKYQTSSLRKDSAQYILKKLQKLMNEQKFYLDCEITLASLARSLATNSHYLSQILNEELGKNFSDYINVLRIEHAKFLLSDKD